MERQPPRLSHEAKRAASTCDAGCSDGCGELLLGSISHTARTDVLYLSRMNWLAHLYLSEPTPQFRAGNLLPDLAPASQLRPLPENYQQGIRRHRQIDAFTDAHPRWKSCRWRFPPPYRRFGAILTDVYFDHLLARDWTNYSALPLRQFIDDVYSDIEMCLPELPAHAAAVLDRMREQDWLGSYPQIAGIGDTLKRMSSRLRRQFDLSSSLRIFAENESWFHDDFHVFFPELIRHVQVEWIAV